ncbi:MAG TPA: P1 family peptidase, partial [Pseudonocardiaceae bacterium]
SAAHDLRAPDPGEVRAAAERPVPAARRLNTTIGVIATDAALTKAQCRRVAMAAHDGLARAVRPAHTLYDGDTVFALATGRGGVPDGPGGLNELCAAAADVLERAIVRGVLEATTVAGVTSYRDRYPSALA